MSAVATRENAVPVVRRGVCQACGVVFDDLSRTSPRSYCYECRPLDGQRRQRSGGLAVVPDAAFTVPHFRAWAEAKKLKDGSLFQLEDWQARFLDDLFARDDDGRPVFEELWLIVPEGNGKTTFTSLVVLYVIEHTVEAWCPVAASARDQAVALTYRIASGFVQRNRLDDESGGPFELHPGYREIKHEGSKGTAKIFAADAASGDGVDPVGIALIEELHRLPTLDLYETWSGKLEKSAAQLVVVSTAGAPDTPFEEMRTKLRQEAAEVTRETCFVRAVSPGSVLHDYAVPEDADPLDFELVAAANPSPRKTVETLAKKAAKKSFRLSHWKRFTCNIPMRGDDSAITEREWAAARSKEHTEIPAGEPIWAGLDLAFKWDTTALVPLWWRDAEYRLLGPATILEPPRDGDSMDFHLVERAILDLHKRNPIHTIVVDRSKAEQLCQWISEELGAMVIERAQTNTFAVADYELWMEALARGWLWHTGDTGLASHVLNASAKLFPNGDVRFDRVTPSRGKLSAQAQRVIDALTAASQAHSEAVLATRQESPPVWEAV